MATFGGNVDPRIVLKYCNIGRFGWNEGLLALEDDIN